MRLIIAGGRDFEDYDLLLKTMNNHHTCLDPDLEVVSGAARGADKLGERLAKEFNLGLKQFPADWDTHGKSAGYIRNSEMVDYADILIAFWDGKSKGTKHMIDLATKRGLEVRIVKYTKYNITVGRVNKPLEGYVNIRIDRSSPLGNPFIMRTESERDSVCEKYHKYFHQEVIERGSVREEVIRIYRLVKEGKSVNLQCWCKPKRCHGDTIKSFILKHLEGQ